MQRDFYVTLFSTSSQDIFPKNSKSRFTCKLPKVIKFEDDYEVGVTDCTFSPIIGVTEPIDDDIDVVIIPDKPISDERTTGPLDRLCYILLRYSKRPSIYTKAYFRPFLSKSNYKDFETNHELNVHRVQSKGAETVLFKLYSHASEYRGATETIKNIRIEKNRAYTMKQILWIVVNTFYKVYLEALEDPTVLEHYKFETYGDTISEQLFHAATTFVNRLLGAVQHHYLKNVDETDFLLIYCSIIRERMVGNSLSKVLYIANRKKNARVEQIDVKNIQYFPLCQREISEITFMLGDESGNVIILESDSTPTALTLHFKKIV